MSKKARIISALLAMVMVLVSAAGCGKKGEAPVVSDEGGLNYPNGTITLICPFGAGGGTDALTRKIAEIASKQTGYSIIVENKVGGTGVVGVGETALSKPDGQTICMATIEFLLMPMAGLASYEVNDLRGILRINSDPVSLVVKGDAPYDTLEEYIAAAKATPEGIRAFEASYPSSGWLPLVMLAEQAGVEFLKIPGAGGGASETIQNILGGHLDSAFISPAEVDAYLETGDLKILAVCADERLPAFPEYPTFKESGYDISVGTWRGLVVPKDTPDELVAHLEEVFTNAYNTQEMTDFLATMKFGAGYLGQKDFNKLIAAQVETFRPLVESYKP